MRKEFYHSWSESEIKEWVREYGVLVLFTADLHTKEANLVVHGIMKDSQRTKLAFEISERFGGRTMTKAICNKINEFAEIWYNENVLGRRARVININTKGR